MRLSFVLILLLLVGIGWVVFTTWNFDPAPPPPPPTPTVNATAKASTRIDCYFCNREGRLVHMQPSRRSVNYRCPVCTGAGWRSITDMPPDAEICPDCKGMGICPIPRHPSADPRFRYRAEGCKRCLRLGWIQKR